MDQNVANEPVGSILKGTPRAKSGMAGRVKRYLRPALFSGAGVAVLLAAGIYGHEWWTTGRFMVSTDDAYLQADNVTISPEVSGYIAAVPVQDNEQVAPGQLLARIDDRDYRTALASAQANADAAAAGVDNITKQIAQQKYVIAEAQAAVIGDQASLAFARQDLGRYATLAQSGAGTVQQAQQSSTSVRDQQASLQRDMAAVGVAQTQMQVLGAQLDKARADLALSQAALRRAELNVGYTTITSPIAGVVGERTLRVGQYVQAATQLMAVVPLRAVYIIANYKETQLTDVRPGQPVSISVDTFPGAVVHGVVNSISPASGEEFALLPPDNATGNFTKIVQRVAVKITIDPHDPLLGELRPGMSVEPDIDTKGTNS
ncbi:MAG: HlyD family secretion protein [Acidocella sp.]|nr:HlyD family secretion protein [Acidocella sp.]